MNGSNGAYSNGYAPVATTDGEEENCPSPVHRQKVEVQMRSGSKETLFRRGSKERLSASWAANSSNMLSRELPPSKPSCIQSWRDGDFTILPEENPKVDAWDMVVISALFATAVLLPFEVALVTEPPQSLYIIGKVIDSIFSLDIVLTFNIAYAVSNPKSTTDVNERRPLRIAAHYMAIPFSDNMSAGWFWPDLLTVIPWEAVPGVKDLNSLRLVRVLRLVRMLRLVRVIKLFKRWQTHSGFSYSLVTIVTTGSVTLLLVHWLACLWGHLGLHPEDYSKGQKSWLYNHLTDGRLKGPDLEGDLPSIEVYTNALYFCTVVLTTVGFGDMVPQNEVEVVVMIFTIFVTGITWAWVVANVVNVITNMDVFGTQFNQIMDDLNTLMRDYNLQNSLRLRIRRHIHESYHVQRRRHHQQAITWLSAGLQGEFAIESGVDRVADCFWYFRGVNSGVLIELADEFKGNLFSPNEILMDRNSASVIMRGSCMRRGKMYSKDGIIGEDMILASEHLRDSTCPRTLTFMEVMTIMRDSLKEACGKYPDFDMRLRRAQVKLALWRSFIRTAEERRKKRGTKSTKSAWDKSYFSIEEGGASQRQDESDPLLPKVASKGWAESMDKSSSEEAQNAVLILTALTDLRKTVDVNHYESVQKIQAFETRFQGVEGTLQSLGSRMESLQAQLDQQRNQQARLQQELSRTTVVNNSMTSPASPSKSGGSGLFR